MTNPSDSRTLILFPGRSRVAVLRDVLVIAVYASILVAFLAQVWRAPAPSHPATEQASTATAATVASAGAR